MSISRQDVLHVAKLAKLQLDEDEVESMREDLEKILDYVTQLSELETKDVPPTAHVAVAHTPLRDDTTHEVLSTEETLEEAPRRSGDGFAVPAFVDEG
jgi:aspartyl-tRNA(Asn)/glutamyl-tRNA(Gln) amidotransferase subunit C